MQLVNAGARQSTDRLQHERPNIRLYNFDRDNSALFVHQAIFPEWSLTARIDFTAVMAITQFHHGGEHRWLFKTKREEAKLSGARVEDSVLTW